MTQHSKKIVAGAGGLFGGTSGPSSIRDNLISDDVVEFTLGIAEGPIAGLARGPRSFYLDDTPLVGPNGDNFFDPFSIEVFHGESNPSLVKNTLGGTSSNIQVGVQMAQGVQIVRTTPANLRNQIDQIDVRLVFHQLAGYDDRGAQTNYNAEFEIQYRQAGETTWNDIFPSTPTITLYGKTTSNYPKEFVINVPRIENDWEIRVNKIQEDSNPDYTVDFSWESFQCTTQEDRSYPNLALVRGIGKASDRFSSIPQFSGVYGLLLVKVPSNYDPITRYYAGIWDGTFKIAHTDNPVWAVYDMIMNPETGLKASDPDIGADRFSFYEAAKWCDELVPIPSGGYQPRWTYNDLMTTARNGLSQIHLVAGSFGGIIDSDRNGNVVLRVDKPGTISQIFGEESVENGIFNYQRTDVTERINDITVKFINTNLGWNEDARRVFDQALIDKNGRLNETMTAIGCIDPHEGQRRAFRRMVQANTEQLTVSFTTTRAGISLDLFQLIGIADPEMNWGLSGRVSSRAFNTITLRDPLMVPVNTDLTFDLQTPSGVHQLTVRSSVANTKELTITAGSWPADTPEFAQFTLSATDIGLVKPFRVLRIQPMGSGDDDRIQITALEHNVNKYGDIDNMVSTGTVTYDFEHDQFPLPPEVSLVESGDAHITVNADGTQNNRLLVKWVRDPRSMAREFEVAYRIKEEQDYQFTSAVGTEVYISNVIPGRIYEVKVRGINTFGRKGIFSDVVEHTVVGRVTTPGVVSALTATIQGQNVEISFDPLDDVEVAEYQIRHGADWATGTFLGATTSDRFTDANLQSATRTYHVKTLTKSGLYSSTGASVTATFALPSAPTGWTVASEVRSVNLRGPLSTNPNFHHFNIYAALPGQSFAQANWVGFTEGGQFSFVPIGGESLYWLTEVDVWGRESASSASITGNPAPVSIPDLSSSVTDAIAAAGASATADAAAAQVAADAALVAQDAAEDAQATAEFAQSLATAAAAAAGLSEDSAAADAIAALGSANAAANSESNAASSETTATGAASSAASSAVAAAASESDAGDSATAAAVSASTASTFADDASTSAAASETARLLAETARGAAETAESNAASSETTAAGSAASAASSASVAAEVTAQALPSDFQRDDFFFRSVVAGAPDPGVSGLNGLWEFGDDAQEGRVLKVVNPTGTYEFLKTEGVVSAVVGRTYRVTVRARYTGSISTSDTYHLSVPIAKLDGTYASIGTQWLSQITLTTAWTDHVQEWTTSGTMPAFWRPGITLKDAVTGTGTIEISRFIFEDITESAEASVQAAAAANSAALAQASEDDAGTYASAAQTAQSLAETAEANALASEASAASSETTALGAAASASAAQSVVAQLTYEQFPHDFEHEGDYWGNGANGDPAALGVITGFTTFPVVDGRKVAEVTASGSSTRIIRARGLYPAVAGRSYRVTIQVRQTAGTLGSIRAWVRSQDAAYATVTDRIEAFTFTALNTWETITKIMTLPDPVGSSVWVGAFFWCASSSASEVYQVRDILFEDVTESENAADSATASASSASTASIAADDAENSADAAEVSRLAAVGAQGAAEAARDLAVSYRDDADGYASSALAAQTLAVSAADTVTDYIPALHPIVPREPREAWTNRSQYAESSLRKPAYPSTYLLVTDDAEYGYAARPFLGGNNTTGHADPLPWDQERVYEVEVHFRVFDQGTNPAGVRTMIGASVFLSDLSSEINNQQTADGYTLIADGPVVQKVWFSYRDLTGIGSPDYRYKVNAPTGQHAYFHIRQNAGGSSDGQISIGKFIVRDITTYVDALISEGAAAASAAASASSASTASAASSDAGNFANAADVSRIAAVGAQGAAEAARDLAVSYRDDADGAAASALASSVLAASLAREAQSYASGNLIVDGIFADDWADYWTGDGNTSIVAYDHSSTVPDADMSLEITGTGYARYLLTGELQTALKGRTLRFSGTRRVAGTTYKVGIRWATIDTNSYLRMQTVTLSATADVWETFERDFTLTNNPNEKATNILFQAVQGATDVSYLTDFRVEDITETTELSGRISSIEALDISELTGTAIATFLGEMEVNASGNSAKVTEWSQTKADVDGFASAFTGVTAQVTGGAVSGFKATSWADPDGSGGATLELLGDVIAQGTLSTNRLTVGLQNNMIQDSRFMNGLANWNSWGSGGAGSNSSLSVREPGETWAGLIDNTLAVFQPGTETDGFRQVQYAPVIDDIGTQAIGIPVTEGKRYSWSARVSAHRCSCQIVMSYYDESNVWVGSANGTYNVGDAGSNNDPHSWVLLHVTGTVPVGASYAKLSLKKYGTSSGGNSWMFIAEPMFAETHTDATEPTPYSPPDSSYFDGGRLFINSVTADKMNVTELSAITATLGTFQTAATGERVVISDDVIKVFDASNQMRVRIGDLTA
jgi:predicted phage tail protein